MISLVVLYYPTNFGDDMASIIKKMKKGHAYYYLVESARVNGKPRIIKQRYLGTADSIGAAFDTAEGNLSKPEFSKVIDFGAVAALFDISERIGIRQIIEKHVDKREQGLSVSDTIVLAAINRAVMPVSKKGFYDWFKKTVLPSIFIEANSKNLSSQGFWNNMKQLDQDKIRAIENEITRTIIQKYDVTRDCLLFDNTNFFTYIDTNTPATLAVRGKSKEKRSDLKIVGLSMMASPDHSIPLFHEVYPGNTHDSKQFATIVDKLKSRFAGLGKGGCRITIVFDKGNNSEDNIEATIGDAYRGFDFVGGLKFNQCPEFNTIGFENFSQLEGERLKGTSAYRTTKHIYGRDLTVVLTYNQALYEAQLDGITSNIEKCSEKLKILEKNLYDRSKQKSPKGKPPTLEGVKKSIAKILSAEYMKELFIWNVWKESGKCMQINSFFNIDAFEKLKAERLGRAILFTNHNEWSTERIVSAYRSQHHIEEAFRRMKDTKYLSFRPIHHFTDSNIVVHAFYCVLALLLASLLSKELEEMGHKVSVHKMLEEFQDIRQIITVFSHKGKKKHNISSFTSMEGFTKDYIDKYDLTKLAVNC